MAAAESWQTAEIAGPKKASVISKPEIVTAMIKRAKRPILIVGHMATEIDIGERKPIDYMIQLAEKTRMPVVATAHTVKEFMKRGYEPAAWMPAVDIGNRLVDSTWKGIDGKGAYDIAIWVGLPYYMEWTILSGLKSFAKGLKTIALDNHYQPNADWSFPNMSLKDWEGSLRVIIDKFEEEGK